MLQAVIDGSILLEIDKGNGFHDELLPGWMGVSMFTSQLSFSEILQCPCAVYITHLVKFVCKYLKVISLLLPLSTATSKGMASPTPTQNPLFGMRAVSEIGPDAPYRKPLVDLKGRYPDN